MNFSRVLAVNANRPKVVNGMMYDRGSAADYDAWEALGNKGWGWSGIYPFFQKGSRKSNLQYLSARLTA